MRTLLLALLCIVTLPARSQSVSSAQPVSYYDNLAAVGADGSVIVLVGGLASAQARTDSVASAAEVWRRSAPDGPFERLARLTPPASWAAFQAAAGPDLVRALETHTGRRDNVLWDFVRANPDPLTYGRLSNDPRFVLALGAAYDDRSAAALPQGTALEYAVRYFDRAGRPYIEPTAAGPTELRARVRTVPPSYPVLNVKRAEPLPRDSLLLLTWSVSFAEAGLDSTNLPFAGRVYRQQGTGSFEPLPSFAEASLNVGRDSLELSAFDTPPPGLVYRYLVRPVNHALYEGPASDTASVIAAWFGRVPLLDSVRVVSDTLGVRLNWTPLAGVYFTGVKIWRSLSPDGPYAVLDTASTSAGSYLDRTAPPARLVYYRVAALTPKTDGEIPQITVSGTWENRVTPPPPPENLAVRPAGRDVEVSWALPADTSDVAGYRVWRSFGAPGRWQAASLVLPPDVTAFADTSGILSGAGIYFYTVESMSRSGLDGFRAAPVSIRPARPVAVSAPLGVSAAVFGNTVTLLWPSVAERDALVTGYLVYRSVGDAAPERATRDTLRTITWTDTTAVPGQTYRYHVTAVAFTGDESRPSPGATAVVPIEYLSPPDVRAWRTDEGAVLMWGQVADETLVGYRILRRAFSGDTFTAVTTLDPALTSWTDPQAPAEAIVYVVAAVYRDGTEVRSDERTVGEREGR